MEEPDIKLPEPIHTKKIHEKLDLFSQDNPIRRWSGYDIIDTLFYLYLFNKYKNQCLIQYKGVTSKNALGVELQIKQRMTQLDKQVYQTHLNEVASQLANCIKKEPTSIVIPLYLKTAKGGHANILIYRKDGNVIEHFEPHGDKYSYSDQKINDLVDRRLNDFIKVLNNILKKDKKPSVTLMSSNIVCPRRFGLQNLEAMSKSKKLRLEGGGYCAAWSMFFTEVALKNPTIPSNELLNIIFNKLDTIGDREKQADYLRKIIIGYINLINEKIEKYFSFITGTKMSLESITQMIKNTKNASLFKDYNTILNIEMLLLNNPNLTKQQYLNSLIEQERNVTDRAELEKIRHNINILERMDDILNPSPVSDKSMSAKSKTKSKSPSPKNVTVRKKRIKKQPVEVEEIIVEEKIEKPISSPKQLDLEQIPPQLRDLWFPPKALTPRKDETPIELESLSSVSSFIITPNCPEGKVFDSQKGRCVKIKTKTQKISPKISPKIIQKTSPKAKTKKVKPCPEGEERNPETGRCKKIKVYPPCPPGQERDPVTHRCKTIKLKKK
jgi:hypothetical protein